VIRYRATELRENGYGRRVYADQMAVIHDVAAAMGGLWLIDRQYKDYSGTWRRDGGRQPAWTVGVDVAASNAWEGHLP
jgi:hypothetical protein